MTAITMIDIKLINWISTVVSMFTLRSCD